MRLPWRIVEPLDSRQFAELRRTAIFECCKYDPQVEDVDTLSSLPLVLAPEAWAELRGWARQLARETMQAEQEILRHPQCWRELGVPWWFRRRLRKFALATEPLRHLRLVRFDFHFTTEGWRISEANSDVPGGFNEASGFTRLMAQHYVPLAVPGDPTLALATAIREVAGDGGTVALVHATAFTDDRQVMEYLARQLAGLGLNPVLAGPDHLRWEGRQAYLDMDGFRGQVDFVFRFFPTEWLPALPRRCAWWQLLGASETPLCNPGSTILTQTKRFPLVWDQLAAALPTWRSLLPLTCDPRQAESRLAAKGRVLKPALGRVGDMIKLDGVTRPKEARRIERAARRFPREWVAQQRFEAVPLVGPTGELFPCIGVYTLNERVIGAYGRVARQPLIDHLAQDAAVLIAPNVSPRPGLELNSHESNRTLQPVGA